jgi:hypothetical protein
MATMTSTKDRLTTARQAAADAIAAAASLRDRARNGEAVSGADLAAADAAVELADLPLPALEAQAAAEQEIELEAEREAVADRIIGLEAAAVAAFHAAADDVRTAFKGLLDAARTHSAVIQAARSEVYRLGGEDQFGALSKGGMHAPEMVRRRPLTLVTLGPWLEHLLREAKGEHIDYPPALYPSPVQPTPKDPS